MKGMSIVNDELGNIWKKAVVPCFKVYTIQNVCSGDS
jgi:hypothetical protein